MTKLTTERLETIATWRETYGNGANVMIPAEEAELMARQLLAYEQAADRPVGEIFRCSGNKTLRWWNDVPEGTVLYAAPVLPKQPELLSIGELLHRLEEQTGEKWVEESAQPVIPRKWTIFNAVSFIAEYKPTSYEEAALLAWNTCRAEMLKAQQNEPQNIPENIPTQPAIPERPELRYGDNVLWFLNELAAFDASDIDSDDFDVYGEDRNGMEGCATISITELAADAAKLLSAQPVSEPKEEGDFLSRLKAEHVELEDRCIKLANFIESNPAFKNLAPRMQRLLKSQANAMVEYDSILERRIYLIEDASAPAQEQK